MTVSKKGPQCPAYIDPDALERAIAAARQIKEAGNDSNLLIVFYVQIMPDDLVMQLHRF